MTERGFPLYGDAFAQVVNAHEPRLGIEPRNTKGSTENVALLALIHPGVLKYLGEIGR